MTSSSAAPAMYREAFATEKRWKLRTLWPKRRSVGQGLLLLLCLHGSCSVPTNSDTYISAFVGDASWRWRCRFMKLAPLQAINVLDLLFLFRLKDAYGDLRLFVDSSEPGVLQSPSLQELHQAQERGHILLDQLSISNYFEMLVAHADASLESAMQILVSPCPAFLHMSFLNIHMFEDVCVPSFPVCVNVALCASCACLAV